jgi:hypothetical protein
MKESCSIEKKLGSKVEINSEEELDLYQLARSNYKDEEMSLEPLSILRPLKNSKWLWAYQLDAFLVILRSENPNFKHCLCHPDNALICGTIQSYKGNKDLLFIAIVGGNHWVTIHKKNGVWHIYDSIGYEEKHFKDLFKKILPRDESVVVRYMDCEKQCGSDDCGLFALAYCQCLIKGINPEQCSFDQKKMRETYNNSIKNKKSSNFIYKNRQIIKKAVNKNLDLQ